MLLLQLSVASPTDAKVLRDAREAQQRFEVTRRWHLPRGTSGSSHPCDAVIGRFCYWYDSTETTPPPEPPRISAARQELHTVLEMASQALPHSAWVAGQRVRYLIEGARLEDAVRAARACAADAWWCAALEGLALHASQRYVEADSAFRDALAKMTEERRCAWIDLRHLTTGPITRELGRASCDERLTLVRRLWLVGKPLWSTPGNDAATEHFARRTMVEILTGSANAYGTTFGADNRELVLRYGWPEWFTREEPSMYQVASPRVIGHDREPSYPYFPQDGATLREPRAVARYAPRHVEWMGELRHQLARFPRGDSMQLVAVYRVADAELGRDSIFAAIATSDGMSPRVVGRSATRQLVATIPRDTTIASIEVVGVRTRRTERARYTVDPLPCSRWCLSDLLLFAPRDSAQNVPLDAATRDAIPGMTVSAAQPLGVYWEVTRVGATALELTLTIEPIRVSRLRRAAARIKLASEPSTVRLHWVEMPDPTSVSHSISLRLPASARGHLRVVLSVQPRGHAPLTASREIEVR